VTAIDRYLVVDHAVVDRARGCTTVTVLGKQTRPPRTLFATVAVGIMATLSVALIVRTLQHFTVAGSAEHSNAWGAVLTGCPQDEGEALADHRDDPRGVPVPGAQARCRREGRLRVADGTGSVVLTVVMASVLAVTRRRSGAPAPPAAVR
jgi:hypothetical protein